MLFFLSALYGLFMRLNAVYTLPFFDYAKFLQAHSHITFLGWGFMSVTALYNWLFLPKYIAFNSFFKWLFGVEFLSIGLMLISFPIQGYKAFSIVLLSVFLLTSYVYIFNFFKHYIHNSKHNKTTALFIKSSLLFYILSSFGIWAIGIVVATQGKTDLYYNSIYFYLHFLYNGFFVFALFGLFIHLLTKKGIHFSKTKTQRFFWLMFIACIPAFTLSLVKSENMAITSIGIISASIQLFALYYLIGIINSIKLSSTRLIKTLISVVLLSYFIKVILQFGSSIPIFKALIVGLKSYFVIGYIHLVTLGIVSSMIIYLLFEFKLLNSDKKYSKMGVSCFLLGVISTEFTLFIQGILIWAAKSTLPNYSHLILIESAILLIGILYLLIGYIYPNSKNNNSQM